MRGGDERELMNTVVVLWAPVAESRLPVDEKASCVHGHLPIDRDLLPAVYFYGFKLDTGNYENKKWLPEVPLC